MRLVFATDLHGREGLYHSLAAWIRAQQGDALVLGGDLLPTFTGAALSTYRAARRLFPPRGPDASMGQAAPDLVQPRRTLAEHVLAPTLGPLLQRLSCATQAAFLTDFLGPWTRSLDVPTYLLIGNHCWLGPARSALSALQDSGRVHLLHRRQARLPCGTPILGFGCTPPSPGTHKDLERRDLRHDVAPAQPRTGFVSLDGRIQRVRAAPWLDDRRSMEEVLETLIPPSEPWVLVAHCPPHDTLLDRDLLSAGAHRGSRAVRGFIHAHQPAISLHGHYHEAPLLSGAWHQPLGQTLAIQPGQDFGALHACALDLDAPGETLVHTRLPVGSR